jgi:hypothetical protein
LPSVPIALGFGIEAEHSTVADPHSRRMTGVDARLTFAGLDLATAQQRFVQSTGTLADRTGYLFLRHV